MPKFLRTSALVLATASTSFVAAPESARAQAYPIDCAILLCLSGGWPASVPCARARAEFIRRITPWPVEPPLQIWRCPMGASFNVDPSTLSAERIYDILMDDTDQQQSFPTLPLTDYRLKPQPAVLRRSDAVAQRQPKETMLHLIQQKVGNAFMPTLAVDRRSGGTAMPAGIRLYLAQTVGKGADIDVTGIAFDFIRSIDLFQVELRQHYSGGEDDFCDRSAGVRRGTYDATGQFTWRSTSYTELPAAFVGDEGYAADCPDVSVRAVFVDWNDYEGTYGFEQVNY